MSTIGSEGITADPSSRRIGMVGVGTMGQPMALLLLAAGHQLQVHDRAATARESMRDAGATVTDSTAAAADGSDVTLLSLPGPNEVREAVTGSDGILTATKPPSLIIDLSTNSVEVVRELRTECEAAGVAFIDAPVSGGVAKARAGTLTVMVGATETEFAAARGILELLGTDVIHAGPSGSGTIAKIVNNQLFLAAGVLVQEAYLLGQALGMEPAPLHRIIASSSAAPYAKLAPLLLGRNFDEVIFRLDIAAKDLALATESAAGAGIDTPLTQSACDVFAAAVDAGDGALVFHATLRELERRAGVELPKLTRPPRPEAVS